MSEVILIGILSFAVMALGFWIFQVCGALKVLADRLDKVEGKVAENHGQSLHFLSRLAIAIGAKGEPVAMPKGADHAAD